MSPMRVLGPYVYPSGRLAGRRYVIILNDDGSRQRQTLYSRWLMEQKLGRRLLRTEEVHHQNEDFTDDSLSNLEILPSGEHQRLHSTGRPSPNKGKEVGWRHGTQYGWMKKHCACPECSSAKEAFDAKRRAERPKITSSAGPRGPYNQPAGHGTRLMYHRGCHCDLCKAANAEHARQQRAKQ